MRTGSPKIKTLAAVNRAAADTAALELWRKCGADLEHLSSREIAEELNRRGVPTPRGGRWHQTSVVRLLARVRAADGTITYRESSLLRRAVRYRMETLRRFSRYHPQLAVLETLLEALRDDFDDAGALRSTDRYRPEISPVDGRYLRSAVASFVRELARNGHDQEADELVRVSARLWPGRSTSLEATAASST